MMKYLIHPKHWAEKKARKDYVCLNPDCKRPILKGSIYYKWGHRFHTLIACSPFCLDNQDGVWH